MQMQIVVGYRNGEVPDEVAWLYSNRVYDVGPQIALQEIMSSGFSITTQQLETSVILHRIIKEKR